MFKQFIISIAVICFYLLPSNGQVISIDSISDEEFKKLNFYILNNFKYGDSIFVMVQVYDDKGRFISGMAPKENEKRCFKKLLNKNKTDLCKNYTVLESTELKGDVYLNFAVVLDYSGSMVWDYADMQQAAQTFIDSLSRYPNVRFSRVNFDDEIDVVERKPVQNPKSVLKDNFEKYGGGTALFAAADVGAETLKDEPGGRFVVLFTDGRENSSFAIPHRAFTPNQLIENSREVNALILGIGYGGGANPDLMNICQYTGGRYMQAFSIDDLYNTFNEIHSRVFSNFYLIRAKCTEQPDSILITSPSGAVSFFISGYPEGIKKQLPPEEDYVIQFGAIPFNKASAGINSRHQKYIKLLVPNLVTYLKANPTHRIEIRGHASPDGQEADNHRLAFARAEAVFTVLKKEIFEKYGADLQSMDVLNQISFKGYGIKQPIYPVDSRSNFENRRVEIVLVKS